MDYNLNYINRFSRKNKVNSTWTTILTTELQHRVTFSIAIVNPARVTALRNEFHIGWHVSESL